MDPERELDALLSAEWSASNGEEAATGELVPDPARAELLAPLAAARRLEGLRQSEPSADFAHTLEERLLARVDALAESMNPALRSPSLVMEGGDEELPRRIVKNVSTRGAMPHGWPVRWVVAVAAALLVVVMSGAVLRAAASALPGSPLYGLRRLEQGVQTQLAGSAAARVRLHLQYANEALTALQAAAAGHGGADAYDSALDALRSELGAAQQGLAQVAPGADHDDLAAQLAQLRGQVQQALDADLPSLSWSERIATTRVLVQVGGRVPTVTRAHVVESHAGGSAEWRITVDGSGFAPGAVLLVNVQPAGSIRVLTATVVQATVENPPSGSITSIGIGNPDGTAVVTTDIQVTDAADNHGPSATPLPGTNNGGHGGHGGHNATPTPSGS
jgi:hypothetical protein